MHFASKCSSQQQYSDTGTLTQRQLSIFSRVISTIPCEVPSGGRTRIPASAQPNQQISEPLSTQTVPWNSAQVEGAPDHSLCIGSMSEAVKMQCGIDTFEHWDKLPEVDVSSPCCGAWRPFYFDCVEGRERYWSVADIRVFAHFASPKHCAVYDDEFEEFPSYHGVQSSDVTSAPKVVATPSPTHMPAISAVSTSTTSTILKAGYCVVPTVDQPDVCAMVEQTVWFDQISKCVWQYTPWEDAQACSQSRRADTMWFVTPSYFLEPQQDAISATSKADIVAKSSSGGYCIIPGYSQDQCDRFSSAIWNQQVKQCVWDYSKWQQKEGCIASDRNDAMWWEPSMQSAEGVLNDELTQPEEPAVETSPRGYCILPDAPESSCNSYQFTFWNAHIGVCVWNYEPWANKDACIGAGRQDVDWLSERQASFLKIKDAAAQADTTERNNHSQSAMDTASNAGIEVQCSESLFISVLAACGTVLDRKLGS